MEGSNSLVPDLLILNVSASGISNEPASIGLRLDWLAFFYSHAYFAPVVVVRCPASALGVGSGFPTALDGYGPARNCAIARP